MPLFSHQLPSAAGTGTAGRAVLLEHVMALSNPWQAALPSVNNHHHAVTVTAKRLHGKVPVKPLSFCTTKRLWKQYGFS